MSAQPWSEEPTMDERGEERDWLPLTAFAFVVLPAVAFSVIRTLVLPPMSRTTGEITTTLRSAYDDVRGLAFAKEGRIFSSRNRFLTDNTRCDVRLAEAFAAASAALLPAERGEDREVALTTPWPGERNIPLQRQTVWSGQMRKG